MELLDVIKARKSVRYYDADVKIARTEIEQMIAEAALAPSGNNIQPWRVVAVENQEVKEQLKKAAFGQQQVADAPVVFAFFAKKDAYKSVDAIYEMAVEAGYMTAEAKEQGIENMLTFYGNANPALVERNVVVDTSLFAMQMMLVVKNHGYDSVPMSGFSSQEISKVLGMDDSFIPIMILPVGKAIKPAHNTVRLSVKDITTFI